MPAGGERKDASQKKESGEHYMGAGERDVANPVEADPAFISTDKMTSADVQRSKMGFYGDTGGEHINREAASKGGHNAIGNSAAGHTKAAELGGRHSAGTGKAEYLDDFVNPDDIDFRSLEQKKNTGAAGSTKAAALGGRHSAILHGIESNDYEAPEKAPEGDMKIREEDLEVGETKIPKQYRKEDESSSGKSSKSQSKKDQTSDQKESGNYMHAGERDADVPLEKDPEFMDPNDMTRKQINEAGMGFFGDTGGEHINREAASKGGHNAIGSSAAGDTKAAHLGGKHSHGTGKAEYLDSFVHPDEVKITDNVGKQSAAGSTKAAALGGRHSAILHGIESNDYEQKAKSPPGAHTYSKDDLKVGETEIPEEYEKDKSSGDKDEDEGSNKRRRVQPPRAAKDNNVYGNASD